MLGQGQGSLCASPYHSPSMNLHVNSYVSNSEVCVDKQSVLQTVSCLLWCAKLRQKYSLTYFTYERYWSSWSQEPAALIIFSYNNHHIISYNHLLSTLSLSFSLWLPLKSGLLLFIIHYYFIICYSFFSLLFLFVFLLSYFFICFHSLSTIFFLLLLFFFISCSEILSLHIM